MNLECGVCTARKIATSFHSLDDLQAHLISNHYDGPSDVFQFVCQNCDFKFGTEYRLLRHEEKCRSELRSIEDMEKIRYQLQTYELLEESLKYSITKNQTYSLPPDTPSSIETSETREQQCLPQIHPTVANMTNKIHVIGPCLHPTQVNARDYQRDEIRTYFSQFGKIINVAVKEILDDLVTDSLITFARCDSVAKCIEQGSHKILGQNFYVERTKPSKGVQKKIIAYWANTNP